MSRFKMENLERQGFRTLQTNSINEKIIYMQKIIFLLIIIVATIGSSCTNAGEQNKQEIKSEKHDSTHKEREEMDTIGMKMGGNELDTKKK